MKTPVIIFFLLLFPFLSCKKDTSLSTDWNRVDVPVMRDAIDGENYEVASDAHVFHDTSGNLKMIYSGDVDGKIQIKLASGLDWTSWEKVNAVVYENLPSGEDTHKETPFYRLADNGKHQIFFIGYDDEVTYKSQVFMAESDNLEGPYTTIETPVVPRGEIAGKDVYLITSPSIVEHDGVLHMAFLAWNASPEEVTEVWVMGAKSVDDGYTWSDFEEVECPIGMEGQLTKGNDGKYYAVSTQEYEDREGIYYAEAAHPFGPWEYVETPVLVRKGKPYEKSEIIAPQLILNPANGKKHLYYTGADQAKGWWIMMAVEP